MKKPILTWTSLMAFAGRAWGVVCYLPNQDALATAKGNAFVATADTAAAVSNLDLVVSVDTSVAHIAGALGWPIWTLLPFVPDWRWLLERDDSPWYPTMQLFRQSERNDWKTVIERLRTELIKTVKLSRH